MKLAVFYHARLTGGNSQSFCGVETAYGQAMFCEQMRLMESCGLYENANEIFVGLNGQGAEFCRAQMPPGCQLIEHGPDAESLLPTFLFMQEWAKTHPDWFMVIWHMKGCTHQGDALNIVWRRCMERHVIENWQGCVDALQNGYDSAGAHWLTPEKHGDFMGTPIWGGAFYWVTAKFFATLPPLPPKIRCRDDWFLAERLIGSGKVLPKCKDFASHWPGLKPCSQ